ncbi:MAG: SDR family oxidoreductase [Alphaproteobacteria bacterium]|nr:SDR family oxidoreductase [Alphaproteobacteria bacterium]
MYKPFDLTGRTALVTGGNGGIGFGMAKALAEAGADVAIWGQNPEKTEAARQKLAATGRRIVALQCNVADEKAVEAAFTETVRQLGAVDACFANAGVSAKPTPLLDMTAEEWRRVLSVNLDGLFFTFRAAARHMSARGQGGTLVATASTAAIEGAARNSHYGASKGAVTSFVRALAVELARYRIRVNSILPGWIETEMTARAFGDEKFRGNVMPRIPARRWGTWDDFGGIAVYLASDASAYHTGEAIVIDGGYTKF